MCGRFTLVSPIVTINEYFGIDYSDKFLPRYNIAPSQNVIVIRQNESGQRLSSDMRWGLIPSWLKEEDISSQWINARADTVDIKPLFKHAFKQRRCLIAADGFYEWEKTPNKRPYYIHKLNGQPFAMAGLWEQWKSKNDEIIESCTIITTDANKLLKPIHNRMPVILKEKDFSQWLDPKNQNIIYLKKLLLPYSTNDMEAYPISTYVNNPRHDSAECIMHAKVDP